MNKKLLTDKKINRIDTFLGYLALVFLVAGTLRAIQLEAGNKNIIYILGGLLVAYALNSVVKLFK